MKCTHCGQHTNLSLDEIVTEIRKHRAEAARHEEQIAVALHLVEELEAAESPQPDTGET